MSKQAKIFIGIAVALVLGIVIIVAAGPFDTGDTVPVYSEDGTYQGERPKQ